MINFRYHVVSLTAVFLALAVGLVLGTAALDGTRTDALSERVGGLRKSNAQYRGQVRHLTAELRNKQAFDRQLAPRIVAGTLTGRTVLVLAMPGADPEELRGTGQMLGVAGATVTGEVRLTDAFTDPANRDALGDLASAKLPVDIHAPGAGRGDGAAAAAALLAAALTKGQTPVSADSRTTVLTAYSTGGNLVVERKVRRLAGAVVVVAGPPATGRDAASRSRASVSVVRAFARSASVVVAGPGTSGSLVGAVRRDGRLSRAVSTVDSDLVQGRITSVLALSAQLSGSVGQYGLDAGATALVPDRD